MKQVNIHETKTNLSSILKEIEQGETYLICRNGKPVAEIIPHKRGKRTQKHPLLSRIKLHYDPTEELSSSEWGEIE
jgi:prevent-host-death family protein